MTESYTPNQFIKKINQDNPSSPTFDPLKTQELRQRIEDNILLCKFKINI